MSNIDYNNYCKNPIIKIKSDNKAFGGYNSILSEIKSHIPSGKFVLNADTYPGVYDDEIVSELQKLKPALFISMRDCYKNNDELDIQLKYNITDDRVFGKMYFGDIDDFLDEKAAAEAVEKISNTDGLIIVYGFGSHRLFEGNMLVYCDVARWEIQMRFRKGMGNYFADNANEDNLRKFKRGYFIEWRVADKHKTACLEEIDYYIDTNTANNPKMITGENLRNGLKQIISRPFRTVPYFDPGVWGG